jgi:hypothetical protein
MFAKKDALKIDIVVVCKALIDFYFVLYDSTE